MRLALLAVSVFLTVTFSACVDNPSDGEADARAKKFAAQNKIQSVYAGDYKFDGRYSQTLVPGVLKALPMQEQFLKSKVDGVDIQLAFWRPDTQERVPAIIQASPYFSDAKPVSGIGQFVIDNFVPHGYAYVQLPVRSTGNSGGCDDFRGPNMIKDLDQAITWIAQQPWSNGNVTLIGISYVGTTPWYAAASGNPAIKTIVPISGSTDAWMVYNRNGSAETRSVMIIPNYGSSAATNPNRSPQHKVENFSCADGAVYKAWAAGIYSGLLGDKEPFREFWDERNVKPKVEKNYKGSILVVHGFEDWNVDPAIVFPWARELNTTFGLPVKTLVGQWAHSYPDTNARYMEGKTNRWDWAEILLHWFDYWLKGINTDLGPTVQVQDNLFRWRNDQHYPPKDANWTTLHLSSGGQLKESPGAAGSAMLIPTALDATGALRQSNSGPLNTHADFVYGPFDEELKISGLPRAHVTVTPQGPGGYIGAFLYSQAPGGNLARIGWTSMNLRFHDGGDQAKTVVPGQPIVAKMEIQPMEAAIPAGHKLVLRVWVNTPSDRQYSLPPTAVTLNWGGSAKSTLELPLIERTSETYFLPPMPPK